MHTHRSLLKIQSTVLVLFLGGSVPGLSEDGSWTPKLEGGVVRDSVTADSERDSLPIMASQELPPPARPDDLLPFAESSKAHPVIYHPQFGFGISVTTLSPNVNGILTAFSAIEQKYEREGYSIGTHDLPGSFRPVLSVSFGARLSDSWGLFLETGRSLSQEIARGKQEYRSVVLAAQYRFGPLMQSQLRPFVQSGVGLYHFTFEWKYDSRISPVSSNGGYVVLEKVSSSGSGIQFIVTGGIELLDLSPISIDAYGTLLLSPRLETQTSPGVTASANFSSVSVGGRVRVYP